MFSIFSDSEMLSFQILVVTLIFGFCVAETSIDSHTSWQFIPRTTCGKGRSMFRFRIIGGMKAFLGEFPWMARLGLSQRTAKGLTVVFSCGGALINRFYVVSAAHCGSSIDIVRLGQNSENQTKNCDSKGCAPPPQDIMVAKYIKQNYSDVTFINDIMLVQLKTAARLDEFTMPICLPRGEVLNMNMVGRELIVAGWGYYSNVIALSSPDLLYAIVPILENEECKKRYAMTVWADRQICAGFPRGADSCAGDSGGPLSKTIGHGHEKQTYLMGVVSYGPGKCGQGPAVYTRITFYMKWILDHIEK